MMSGVVDGRDRGGRSDLSFIHGTPRDESFAQLNKAVRKHANRAGIVQDTAFFGEAPATPADAERILEQARQRGASSVLFLRLDGLYAEEYLAPSHAIVMALNYVAFVGVAFVGLVPSLIVFSIPSSGEYANAKVRGFMVDPETGLVFAEFQKSALKWDKKVTAWGLGAQVELKRMMFNAVEDVFAEAAQAAKKTDRKGGPQTPIAEALFPRAAEGASHAQ